MNLYRKPTYEVTCQIRGCKETVTGIGHPKKRTCYECKKARRAAQAKAAWRAPSLNT